MRGNPLQGSASFTHAGRDFQLVLDNRVWLEAEGVLGYSILDAVEELRAALEAGRNPRLKTMCAIVYGGLKQHQPDVTEDDVVEMFFSGNPDFKAAVLTAMQGAQLPEIEDEAPQAGNAQRPETPAGTGSASSRAGARAASTRKASGGKRRDR
ncbi:hypothetical protein [Novosphingobium album (ex Liu et al. 2023)]|uniref:Gene transfer agent family protein n=1 Tax=Novosphingobium album (ex Liu et al. 2023) TaxID=3031130 RepID=A0ABT5WPA9_9SPHN|nr:hypothetical protein [Novosphingobium album (ex Liu et al. 2023)]MDE8651872.1 hypothetical protein [Novosphingobium album (ex Liu et al. 2023)]